ncbi:MAG TPA: hypothetical protein VI485_06360 [Vicinamibacterales bacterium]|nr:hypothetical protein [Vicinamibacterales bacterium]
MSFTKSARTEMVISMTLAELFLMLLFVVWYGFTPLSGDAELARLMDTVAKLDADLKAAQKKVAENSVEIADLSARLKWWQSRHPDEVVNELKSTGDGSKGRGHDKCDESNNVLVEASVQQGDVSLRVLARPDTLAKSFDDMGVPYPAVKVWLSEADMRGFVDTVRRVNAGAECRWDFRLYYDTKVDGFDGLERFQTAFYLARKFQRPRPE